MEKSDKRLFFPATQRNRGPIGEILSNFLPGDGTILEVASGSGEHGVVFQENFPNISWQTSDPNPIHRKSINAWIHYKKLSGQMPKPIHLEVEHRPWPLTDEIKSSLTAIVCINLIHISPIKCTYALFEESGILLRKHQLLILYGPFKRNGKHTSDSNYRFNESLKAQNSLWGVRDLEAVIEIGTKNKLGKLDVIEMPSNNLCIIFQKK